MDVSNSQELGGEKLVEALASLAGLPEQVASEEINHILKESGAKPGEALTLDALRSAMLAYLQELDAQMTQELALEEAVSTAAKEK